MVADLLLIAASWHPKQPGLNERNPGIVLSLGVPMSDYATVFAAAGRYRDSNGRRSEMAGAGVRAGGQFVGAELALVHTNGAGGQRAPVLPVPSIYLGCAPAFVNVSLFGEALAVSARLQVRF